MNITPQRRRRILRVHYLSQQGHSQRQIAKQLEISHATVRADLQLIETHWSQIAAPAADDLLLESLQLLNLRLLIAIKHDEVANNADHLTPVEYLRAREAREAQLNALAREIRRTVNDVHRRAEQRPDQPGLYDEEPQKLSETSSKSAKIDHPDPTISSPAQEIVDPEAPVEKIPTETVQLAELPGHDALIDEAVKLFPHLNGQSKEQILTFIDQLTDPNTEEQETPPPIYAEAAG